MRTEVYGSTVLAAVVAAGVAAFSSAAAAEPAALQGTWNGGGTIFYSTGTSEGARCRARYTRIAGNTYDVTAACATASTRVDQTAQVRKVSANRYAGTFYNSQYGVTGRISIVVNGRSQTVLLQGSQASARFRLSR